MTGGSKIVALGGEEHAETSGIPAQEDDSTPESTEYAEDEFEVYEEEFEVSSRGRSWLLPALAIAAVLGWTGFFGWVHQSEILTVPTPARGIELAVQWAVPALLVGVLWLLAMRNSTREASRFADAAQALSFESQNLEARLSTINRELSLAREFLGSQGRELDSLGRIAADRLSENADRLQLLVNENGDRIESIASVSETALENMGRLRDDLPVLANSARDVSNQIGNAGRTAHSQLSELVAGFERLNEFGQASERQVTSLRGRVDEALASFEAQASQLEEITATRFAALRSKSDDFRAELDGHEVEALAAMRNRADVLREEVSQSSEALADGENAALEAIGGRLAQFRDRSEEISATVKQSEEASIAAWDRQVEAQKARLTEAIEEIAKVDEQALQHANEKLRALHEEAEALDTRLSERDAGYRQAVAERRAELDRDETKALKQLETGLAEIDEALATRREQHLAAGEEMTRRGEALAERLGELREQVGVIAAQGDEASEKLLSNVSALGEQLSESREAMTGTDVALGELTEGSIRLLELIKGAAEHSRDFLPQSLGEAETKLGALRGEVDSISEAMTEASDKGKALSDYVIASREDGKASAEAIDALHLKLARSGTEHAERLHGLHGAIEKIAKSSDETTRKVQEDLQGSIKQLEDALQEAGVSLTEKQSDRIKAFAEEIAAQSATATEQALQSKTEEAIARVEQAADRAAKASHESAVQLRDQLAMVNELAGNLETRIARAREQAEEQVDNDFARRVALITESLHSNAIDIDKALTSDVSDTAWTAYLRGDRGIFTRRAVRLLDNTEAREIAEVFDADEDFREHVSRYIHDFEAMLRTMLSTRDGNALGVTLLSSDMGKLYVALAQAIERLRD